MIDQYFKELHDLIVSVSLTTAANFQTERRSDSIGFVRGDLTFSDGLAAFPRIRVKRR
jgi:hypothetical protein